MTGLGFIILRHVCSKRTDLYWKESYSCIRKYYPENPIMIIDDSSNRKYLQENILLTNCTVIYDTEHRGGAEFLPYYYFHRLKPFHRAIILHDAVFLQSVLPIDPPSPDDATVQFLWSISHQCDGPLLPFIHELIDSIPVEVDRECIRSMYTNSKRDWTGTFGVMSVVDWPWLDSIQQRFQLFENMLPLMKHREYRCALERVFGLLAYYHQPSHVKKPLFNDIHSYMRWGLTFTEYLENDSAHASHPLIKVWSGR